MTDEELQALCAEWQATLRLQDWDVEVTTVRDHELARSRAAADINYSDVKKHAAIRLLDEDLVDWDSFPCKPDRERQIVHELLHLHFVPFGTEADSPQEVAEEQAVHALSVALVKLKRGG